ncbi:MAG: hypothetical protein O3B64_01845 [bacterium]|nr:hypothetical protein [bacterium]
MLMIWLAARASLEPALTRPLLDELHYARDDRLGRLTSEIGFIRFTLVQRNIIVQDDARGVVIQEDKADADNGCAGLTIPRHIDYYAWWLRALFFTPGSDSCRSAAVGKPIQYTVGLTPHPRCIEGLPEELDQIIDGFMVGSHLGLR